MSIGGDSRRVAERQLAARLPKTPFMTGYTLADMISRDDKCHP